MGTGCPTGMRTATPGARDRPPKIGVRAGQSRAPAFGPWPGTCPRAWPRCSPRAAPAAPRSPQSSARTGQGPAAARLHGAARSGSAPAPRPRPAPAASKLSGGYARRRRRRERRRGRGRRRGRELPEGPRPRLRPPAAPRGATAGPGAPARRPLPAHLCPTPALRTPTPRGPPRGTRPAEPPTQSSLGRPPPGRPGPADGSSPRGQQRWIDRCGVWPARGRGWGL